MRLCQARSFEANYYPKLSASTTRAVVSLQNKYMIKYFFVLLLLQVSILSAQPVPAPCDAKATKRTAALFGNLRDIAGKQIMFGHQDDLAYGVTWKREAGRSDVKDVCGTYPAVFGWDLGSKFGPDRRYNIDSVNYDDMRQWIREVYKIGGISTLSWHLDNLTSGKSSWDTTGSVKYILPGGKNHAAFLEQLDDLAAFLKSLKTDGLIKRNIPVIFRPWHEHTGSWFWWGGHNCTTAEYVQLYRFTVDYLRNQKGVHNVLFCYSPDAFKDKENYLERYPGDEYVDVMGLDYYYRQNNLQQNSIDLPQKLKILGEIAAEHGKCAAFTETGLESIPQEKWWTEMLLPNLENAPIAYVMVWRNARANHCYAPYKGHSSAADFEAFSKNEKMIFQRNVPKMYKR